MIIHLNGWPGVGKGTIGKLVAVSLGARFIENHTLHNVALACAGFGDPERELLYEKVRAAAYDVLSRKPENEVFVMTNALSNEDTKEIAAWQHVVELAIVRKVPLIPIVLTAEIGQIKNRIASPERSEMKLKSPDALKIMTDHYSLQMPAVNEATEISTNGLTAIQSSKKVIEYVESIRSSVGVATKAHLALQ